MKNKIPIVLVTGFLGSGKTSLIEDFLRVNKGQKKVAFLVNEIGTFSVDAKLVAGLPFVTYELNNGCICCSVNKDFVESLSILSSVKEIDVVIIETTGIANPMPIIFSIEQSDFFIDLIICTVDSLNSSKVATDTIFIEQVASSDAIIHTKADLTSDKEIKRSKEVVRKINPHAKNYNKWDVSAELLFDFHVRADDRLAATKPSSNHQHSNPHNIDAFTVMPSRQSMELVDAALAKLKTIDALWRIKGIISTEEHGRLLLNYAFGRYVIDNFINDNGDSDYLIFIGKDMISYSTLIKKMFC